MINRFNHPSAACILRTSVILTALVVFASCGPSPETAEQSKPSGPAEYAYGTVVSFAKGGDSERYRTFGWSQTEEKFTWTEGQAATLVMKVPAGAQAASLRMKLAGLTNPPELPFQPVEVFVNDRQAAEWQVGELSDFTANIPGEITRPGGTLTITLRLPKATSPKALGQGQDPRMLGVSCLELQLTKAG